MSLTLPDYAELHCLSNFSFLRGASHAEELVAQAVEQGYAALAITDECSFAGVVRAHVAAKAQGLKLLIGTELRLADGMKLVLLAQNRAGYGNLSALVTLGRRRAEKGRYHLMRADLAGWDDKGVPDCLALWLPGPDPEASAADAGWLATRFAGRAWIAVERHLAPDDGPRLTALRALAADHGLPLVAAGDVHMHVRGRRALQDVLTVLRLNIAVDAAGAALFPNGERHLRSRLALGRLYPPELLAETLQVAARCDFSLDELRYEYPEEIVPPGMTPASYLRAEVEAGLVRRYGTEASAALRHPRGSGDPADFLRRTPLDSRFRGNDGVFAAASCEDEHRGSKSRRPRAGGDPVALHPKSLDPRLREDDGRVREPLHRSIHQRLLIHRRFRIQQQRHHIFDLGFGQDACITKTRHVDAGVVRVRVPNAGPGVLHDLRRRSAA